MINSVFFHGLLLGGLVVSVPLSFLVGKHTTVIERERFRVAAIHCTDLAKEQSEVFKKLKKNFALKGD